MRCNICGCTRFLDMPKRPLARCAECGSLERTRVAALYLTGQDKPDAGTRVLHFAPERGLSELLRRLAGDSYRALDIDPARYPGLGVEAFDLCRDVFGLPENRYDLIVHNHVIEHIECNYSAVLLRLMRSLAEGGVMLFSMPILAGEFTDEIITGDLQAKLARFGESLHVRRFGAETLQPTLGMLFRLPDAYDLPARFPEEQLVEANIPPHHWRAYTGASIFRVTKADLRV